MQSQLGQTAPPLPPLALLATVQGTAVTLQWTENPLGPVVASYQLQAGTATGLVDIGVIPLPASARTLAVNAPPGTYFVRLVAVNAAGSSPPSNEAIVDAPAPGVCTPPAAPTGLRGVELWRGHQRGLESGGRRGDSARHYVVEAGTVSGAANIGAVGAAGERHVDRRRRCRPARTSSGSPPATRAGFRRRQRRYRRRFNR